MASQYGYLQAQADLGTVKNHLSNIFSRLELRDRTQAVMYARERGLL
jgi:DNA-binding NarL/FixJ family response regulator